MANVYRQTPLRCFNGTLCKAGRTVVGFYNGSRVANMSEDHFSQANNTKMLFSQGVLKPAGKGVWYARKSVSVAKVFPGTWGESPMSHCLAACDRWHSVAALLLPEVWASLAPSRHWSVMWPSDALQKASRSTQDWSCRIIAWEKLGPLCLVNNFEEIDNFQESGHILPHCNEQK